MIIHNKAQGGAMNPIFIATSLFPLLSSTVRRLAAFVLVVTLFATTACAQGPAAPTDIASKSVESNATTAVLQPYLGKWRPTSFREEMNIVSLTITEKGLSFETGPSLTYEVVRQTDEGVVVRVTGRKPEGSFPGVTALAFSLETHVITSFPPGGANKERLDLWIYSCDSLERLSSGFSKASCFKNGYMR